jgi:hypothetical protein
MININETDKTANCSNFAARWKSKIINKKSRSDINFTFNTAIVDF